MPGSPKDPGHGFDRLTETGESQQGQASDVV